MKPKRFYQWFCPVWQDFEYVLFDCREHELSVKVGKIAEALVWAKGTPGQTTFSHQTLRAMCMSFVMNSLHSHPESQAAALRMLLHFATLTDLCHDKQFIHWVLRFMQTRIEPMIQIKEQQPKFCQICVDFFKAIGRFDRFCVLAALKFFGAEDFRRTLIKVDECRPSLKAIATATFNAALVEPNQFFVFEIISDTELIKSNLDDKQLAILEVFVGGTIDHFDKLLASELGKYFDEAVLDIKVLKFKMRVLTFVTIAHGKETIQFDEAAGALKLDVPGLKRLIVQINETSIAQVRLDAVHKICIVEYCQPRRFTDETWAVMASHLDQLMNSWQTE
jgi:hypothetical protein